MEPDPALQLDCELLVWRVGEIFGEFGIRFLDPAVGAVSNPLEVVKWQLRIATDARDTVFDEELQTTSLSKVVKLKPATAYLAQGRAYSAIGGCWGPWSPLTRTRTFSAVATSITEIGEDYARFMWDRPLRDTTLCAPEQIPDAMQIVSEISQFQLRVVREVDMLQEFSDEFVTGVRTYTLHELRPGTAYIVFARYATLIGTMKQWSEVCRFFTQPSHELALVSRGEDEFTVKWSRSELVTPVGYLRPDSTVHKFEVLLEAVGTTSAAGAGDEAQFWDPVELPASTISFSFSDLRAGGTYRVRLRCLTKEGRWGSHTKPLLTTLAEPPVVEELCVGETIASFAARRAHPEPVEKLLFELLDGATQHLLKSGEVTMVDPVEPVKATEVHVEGLAAGHDYKLRLRTQYPGGVFGAWVTPFLFTSAVRCSVRLAERGEDFLTIDVQHQQPGLPVHVVVRSTGSGAAVLDTEVVLPSDSTCFRISDLDSDVQFEICARSWRVNSANGVEGWGEFSTPIIASTLRAIALHILDVGEDFAQLSWRRALSITQTETPWVDLKYELVLGCLDTGNDNVLHREILDTSYTLRNLVPETSYVISVRACDEREQWGTWCKLQFTTLAPVVANVHEVGEDFVRLVWERTSCHAQGAGSEGCVSKYCVFVFSEDAVEDEPHAESGYHRGGASEVHLLHEVTSHHTSFKVKDLLPDRTYTATVRAATMTHKWGLWSRPIRFRTVAPFRIPASSLSIGENYVHLVWDRDEHPSLPADVRLGDFSVTSQQLRVKGVDVDYVKDHTLPPEHRELKLYGLAPATAYSIQIRACNRSGEWGLWSSAVYIMTRATIACRAVEVAEDYLVIAWEKKRASNPRQFPTGRGFVTSYHLRVSNHQGVHTDTYLGDGDCPYRVANLEPDTFYCVELKANYNDEEWGLWSTPLWCLSMKYLTVNTELISEEFCKIRVARPQQPRRLPEDDGNRATEDRVIAFGQLRPLCLLRVMSTAALTHPHTARRDTADVVRGTMDSGTVSGDQVGERLVYQAELAAESEDLVHTIPNLCSDTVYSVAVRSKLRGGDWGMWSPPQKFCTVSPIVVTFTNIGENSITVDWRRRPQHIPIQVPKIASGLGLITKSRVKIRDQTGSFQQLHEIDSITTSLTIDQLLPATTYQVTVQTFNDNHDWGVWSEEGRARTVASMIINVENVSEDAVWLSWMRKWDPQTDLTHNTSLNVDTVVKAYEVKLIGDGHFCYSRELEGQNCFFRGLRPDAIYEVRVRALSKSGRWGMWSSRVFRTLPTIRVTFGNIGEDFAVVEWRRHLPTSANATADDIVDAKDHVEEFRLKVERVGHEPIVYVLSPTISSFRLTELEPSTEYRVWMCSRGHEGVWGLWNQETRVRTLPQLELEILDIGEDYVTVNWTRGKWIGESAPLDPGVKVYSIEGAVSGYHIKVANEEGVTVSDANTGYMQTKCTLQHLDLRTLYSVTVRAKDTYNEWGLWSDDHRFITLQPVQMNLLRIGEDFVRIEWERRSRLRKRPVRVDQHDADAPAADSGDTGAPGQRHLRRDSTEESTDDDESGADNSMDEDTSGGGDSDGDTEAGSSAISEVYSDDIVDEDVTVGDQNVRQWHVRVYSSRLFGGQPGADDFKEFFVDATCTTLDISDLLSLTTYTVAVRAQNTAGEWGRWSFPQTIETMPLIHVDVTYLAENFVSVSWHRPEASEAYAPFNNFPPARAIHNYRVQIQPLASEAPFDPADEELTADGARQYETSQPSLRLFNLRPGTRYKVIVQEQMYDIDGRALGDYGVGSEQQIVETIEPMCVTPSEIGESFAELSWQRARRERETAVDDAITVTRSEVKIVSYELRLVRMDDQAQEALPNDLRITKSFGAGLNSFVCPNLLPNAIYAVQVRAQTEGEHWGLWSKAMMFVTQKRLTVHVELVNEDNFLVSWTRHLPDWAKERVATGPLSDEASSMVDDADTQLGDEPSTSDAGPDSVSIQTPTPTPGAAGGTTTTTTTTPLGTTPLDSVVLGDYSVHHYELVVEGVSEAFAHSVELGPTTVSTRVGGLAHNTVYAVCVRSYSTRRHWSQFSPKASVCTLKPMEVAVQRSTECMASVRWFREVQAISEHERVLRKQQLDIQRELDQREKMARVQRQQRLQDRDAAGETVDDDDEDAYSVLRHKLASEEALIHLLPENVNLGRTDLTGFQLRLYGDEGAPYVEGTSHILTQRKGKKKKGVTFRGSSSPSRFSKKRSTFVEAREAPTKNEDDDEGGAGVPDARLLFEVKLNASTSALDIRGLAQNAEYEICVRSRNIYNEWGPWCQRRPFTTLEPLSLQHSRFGEHYVNLYWHRISAATRQEIEQQQQALAALNEEFKDVTPKDLEAMRATLPPAEYEEYIGRLKGWKSTQRALNKWKTNLVEGGGEVVAAQSTPVFGYHLRVVHEDGTISDEYFGEGGAGSHQFTVTGLQPNHMYAAMMCADYGNGEWGSWSAPIKFITQNLIQLNITYVGESFIDIEWKRAPNKRVADPAVLVNPTAQGWGHEYQVWFRYAGPSGDGEERRRMRDCNVFRIDSLDTDSHHTICVREWDPKGEWGMWSAPRSCVTLAGMQIDISEIGENWMQLHWVREASAVQVDPDDPQLVQLPVDSEAFYLRVEELRDNGTNEDLVRITAEELTENSTAADPTEHADGEFAEFFSMIADRNVGALPAMVPPAESTVAADGRYLLVRRFGYEVNEFRLEDLKPDRFYSVQILCETSGSQLGSWSPDLVALTLAKVRVRAALVDEESVRVTWQRDSPRMHPRLIDTRVQTGSYVTERFELEARGLQRRNASYTFTAEFPRHVSETKLSDLQIDSLYSIRVRSIDDGGRVSLWSDDLNLVTLRQLRVLPLRVTEQSIQVEWGREVQNEGDYPQCTPPPVLAVDKASQHHLRVYAFNDRELPVIDKQFTGATSRFQLSLLSPNTAYVVQARSCNVIGEWGMWSEERVVYTMKRIALSVMAVGEDYVMIKWARDRPDEVQQMVPIDPRGSGAPADDRNQERRLSDDDDALQALQMRKRYPLLDVPKDVPVVYATERTKILRYALSVTQSDEAEGWTTEISHHPADNTFMIPSLKPDSQYVIAIRACYGDDEWGPWSDQVDTGTLNLLVIDVKYVGEDYLNVVWQRALNSYPVNNVQMGKPEETLGYQFLIHDFTDVPIGEEAAVHLDEVCVREAHTCSKHLALKQLRPNRRYRLTVRRWYRPVTGTDAASALVDNNEEKPMTEEQRVKQLIAQSGGVAGGWSEAVFVLTLKEMVVIVDDIAEDFVNIHWERDPHAAVLPTRQCLRVSTTVHSYHIRIDEMTSDGAEVSNAAGTLHIDSQFGPDDTSFRVTELKPDSVYKFDVRCCTDKVWGMWSRQLVLVTLPKLTITLGSIGEDYVSVNWERRLRQLTLPDGSSALCGTNTSVERYQLEMFGMDHAFHLEKKFKASRTSYRVKRLEAQMLYSVSVRSCDGTGYWSLWSERVVFVTLKPMQLSFGKVGEQFAHVSWSREPQAEEEYLSAAGAEVHLGSTTVLSYHLCVFSMDHSPSAALIDKQFNGQTSQYRLSGLNSNSSYIVIVRACNGDSQWGLWSEERVVTTLRIIQAQVVSIGENYLTVKWSRDDGNEMLSIDTASPLGIRVDPTQYHLCVTSETENVDRNFMPDECSTEGGMPSFTIRSLSPDTRYIVALQACYGNDEWGTWTKPVTFVTLNRIAITVNNISEEKADFAWGRAQQSGANAFDPNIIMWRGTITKYQLVIRKLQQVRAAEQRRREQQQRTGLPGTVVGFDDEGGDGAALEQLPVVPDREDDANPTGAPGTDPDDGGDEIRIEREMEVKQAKYVQTFCSVDQLQVNTDYHVQVRALDDRSEWGEWTELIFDTPPSPPANPLLKKSGAQFVIFSWDAPDPFTRYVYSVEQAIVKDVAGKKPPLAAVAAKQQQAAVTAAANAAPSASAEQLDWRVIDNVEECSCRLRAFGPLNKIRCRVRCCKADKPTHLFSKYSTVALLAQVMPPEPLPSLVLTSLSKTTASLQWSPPPLAAHGGADGSARPPSAAGERYHAASLAATSMRVTYRVLLAPEKQQPALLASTRSTSYDMVDLKPSTTYRVQVQVESENGISSRNIMLRFTTRPEGDKTVLRAAVGQPPLAAVVARAEGHEGASGGDQVRLPTIPQPKAGTSSRHSRVSALQHDPHRHHTPRPPPPKEPGTRKGAPHPPPKRTRSEKEKAIAARRLQPVSAHSGPPPAGEETTVEEFNFVAFDASDDDKE